MECFGTTMSHDYNCGIHQKKSMDEKLKQSLVYLEKTTKEAIKRLVKQYHVIDITSFEEQLCDGYASEINKSIQIKYCDKINTNAIFIWTITNDEFLW